MGFLALFSVVLLVYCTGVCASQESDLVVLTTASRLREEIKSEVNGKKSCLLQNCSSYLVTEITLSHVTGLQTVDLVPGYNPSHPATSCKEIFDLGLRSPSGFYWIRGTDNAAKHVYCDMERSCNGVAGGWMRVASIDMTDTSSTCPSGLRTLTSPRRLCAKNIDGPGCSSAVLPVQGVQYSRVCGKVIGYQQGSPDAFHPYIRGGQRTIDSRYVDGISLTHGTSPRKHIWTFVSALHKYNSAPMYRLTHRL